MNRVRTLIISFIFIAFLNPFARSQAYVSVSDLCYQAYTKGKVELWEQALSSAEKMHQGIGSDSSLHQLILVQYGFTAYCISEKQKERAEEILAAAYGNLDYLMAKDAENAEYIALKAAFLAFELNIHPLKMTKLAPASIELTDLAFKKDSSLLMSLSCKANMLNFTPRIFGGNPDWAIPFYYRIIELFENEDVYTKNDWRYINTLVILADTYNKKKMYKEACGVYERIIKHDSTINWVNNKLYPECRAKLENE
jgi:hypothetical protein